MTRNEAHEVLKRANLKISLTSFRTTHKPGDKNTTTNDSYSLWGAAAGGLIVTVESHNEHCELGAKLAVAIETLSRED